MDETFELQGLQFEWDEEKYAVNLWKHNIIFEETADVFFDPEQQFGDASVEEEMRESVIDSVSVTSYSIPFLLNAAKESE